MRGLSLPNWTLLAKVSFAITLLLFTGSTRSGVEAGKKPKPTETEGTLQALDTNGKPSGLCPLKHTAVKAEISGSLSRVTVTQRFQNPFQETIEAVYTFPLSQSAAVDSMTMVIGNRIIKGEIKKSEEARAAYENAKKLGQVASLLDQQRPNIFTQSVANILTGQDVEITISYVETLQYSSGAYEWVFPMVVSRRYIPVDMNSQEAAVPDADRISPPSVPKGMRAGHTLSLEINLDAGVTIDTLKSESHETEIERPDNRRARLRLKDADAIPNKDFVLRFQVAGNTIEDAVLAHRSSNDGYFTLILQPPHVVVAEDVMPKELVFVLDTSGSMDGFPHKKSKEVVKLALDNLYPHDTFNLITFAGDTQILFQEPVPATSENVRKAKDFLDERNSNGGTEMMKAISAALDPSDSQQHVRIVCFLTDGVVGNDFQILSEIQKHPNARIFAIGFSTSPNRFLLDKMTEFGRGEVEYVSESGENAAVARRFNERVRNPLLTNISLEWSGLSISDIYPTNVPDLFDTKPVVISGRYAGGGKGIIRLKGMHAGHPYTREIPVELPESEPAHDVLAALWARRRIDFVMGRDMGGLQRGTIKPETRDEIVQLGLTYKLLTQFTSFVAIDNLISAPGGEPPRVEVEVNNQSSSQPASGVPAGIQSGISENVTVTSSSSQMFMSESGTLSSVTSKTVVDLPLNSRDPLSLTVLAPGVAPANQESAISVNGQRTTSNSVVVDGVSANFNITPGGQSPGASAGGTSPAVTAAGGFNGVVSLSDAQEIQIKSFYTEPEWGRVPGGQINISTNAGNNEFHGSLFEYVGNDILDASDWFTNSRGVTQPARRLNNFGGTVGGPIQRDRLFFFGSYEGLRLRQPSTVLSEVPSMAARIAAPSNVRPLLEAYPLPNGAVRPDGFAEFAGAFSTPANHDAFSIRVDSQPHDGVLLTGRYTFADSDVSQRGAGTFSLNTKNNIHARTQTLTGSITHVLSPTAVVELRANFSRLAVTGSYLLDNFGGAAVKPVLPTAFSLDLNSRNARLITGEPISNLQRQFNIISASNIIYGPHSYKFGGDYRRLTPIIAMRPVEQSVLFNGVQQALLSVAARLSEFQRTGPQLPVFQNLSMYAQDEWRARPNLTLTYGLRWEFNPPPRNENVFAVDQVDDLSTMKLAPRGARLWETTYLNFAPRVGIAYEPNDNYDKQLRVRAAVGLHYDLGQDRAGEAFTDSFPILTGTSIYNSPFSIPAVAATSLGNLLFSGFDPHLKLPYTLRWNVSVQRALGSQQSLSASYVGSVGRRLLSTETLFDASPTFSFVRRTRNDANSNYRALQLDFKRSLSRNLMATASYTWSKSTDNASMDSAENVVMTSSDLTSDRGPSDFDIRHILSGFVSYDIPSAVDNAISNTLLRNWSIDSTFLARSARPVNVLYGVPTGFGFAYSRPNLVNGVPLYLADQMAPGGKRINPAAFVRPATLTMGNSYRNSVRGFSFHQVDLALRRQFSFNQSVSLQFKVGAFNLLNHPNFEDPSGSDVSIGSQFEPAGVFQPNLTFGQSNSISGSTFGLVSSSRMLNFSMKLTF